MFFVIILAIDADSDGWSSWYDFLPFLLRYGQSENKLISFGIFTDRQEIHDLLRRCYEKRLDGEMVFVPQDLFQEMVACFTANYAEQGGRACMEGGEAKIRARGSPVFSATDVDMARDDWLYWGQFGCPIE
ncbi:related to calcium-binding mitochondrial carrier protein [Sporisorium scitamineum]|uniref:Related to calcium-binding mitochondrial carrier protein n=1 Tax=Sporisorium scitamineum TaxID=49012 RepID=A0A127Z8K1_9BASI|nr:related to calcium-binding mitochondrial carrier protein [Sporisorium scitamineum]